jgi:TetR/AcrR family transcriptional regulator
MTRGKPARAQPRRQPRAVGRPPNSAGHDTAARLLDCALTVFAEKGYAAATTDDIIRAAGVTKPSLYHHHESKEALFRTLVGGIYEASERAWEEAIASEKSCAGKLRGMIRVAFAGSARDPRMPRVMLQTHYGPPIAELRQFMADHTARRFAQVVRVMQDGLARGELRGGDAPALALVFCCLMDQHINALTRLPNPSTWLTAERADALVSAFLHGCGSAARGAVALPPLSF